MRTHDIEQYHYFQAMRVANTRDIDIEQFKRMSRSNMVQSLSHFVADARLTVNVSPEYLELRADVYVIPPDALFALIQHEVRRHMVIHRPPAQEVSDV